MIATLVLTAAACVGADGVETKFLASGLTRKTGGYSPIRAELTESADSVKKSPEGLVAPKYGKLKLGEKTWAILLDEPEGKPAKLFIDANNDGDLTNDPVVTWTSQKFGNFNQHTGSAKIELAKDQLGAINLYRFDPKDPARAALKNTVLYYADFGYELSFELDKKPYSTFTGADARLPLWIDRDGNGVRSAKYETVRLGEPFNFTGTTYVLKKEGDKFQLEKAAKEIPQQPMAPDLRIGKKAIPFQMEALDGSKIDFPKQYAGKIVMVDFWATWCGPCIAELPNVKKAYSDWHDKGFEVLGISFDQENMKEKVEEFLKKRELPWPQIYEGKGWKTTLGEKYDVSAIPFVLLVDGDTGEILGTNKELRGPNLTKFIEQKLQQKKKISTPVKSPDQN